MYVCVLFMFIFYSEILRAVDSLQLTEKNKVATPADWKVRVININHIYSRTSSAVDVWYGYIVKNVEVALNVTCSIQLRIAAAFGSEPKLICVLF
jgi:hypothetical protein